MKTPISKHGSKDLSRLLFKICICFSIIINIVTIKDGHTWGDDFSQYILHAQNILQGRDYSSGIMLDNPVVYPPGFPLLIAPLIKIFGINFKILKLLNIVFWYLSAAFLYPIFAGRFGRETAVLCSLILMFSSYFFVFKQNVISDIPFLFFVTSSVYFFSRYCPQGQESDPQSSRHFFWYFVISASCAFFIRSAGLMLFIAAIFYLLFIQPQRQRAGLLFIVLLFVFGLQTFFMGAHPGSFSVLLQKPLLTARMMGQNFSIIFSSIIWFFVQPGTPLTSKIFLCWDYSMLIMAPVFLALSTIIFFRKVKNRDISFYGCFSFFYLNILIVWSALESPVGGFSRYVLPIAGFVLIFLIKDTPIRQFPQKGVNIILSLVILCNLINIKNFFAFNDDVIYRKENQELFHWVKHQTKPSEYFIFWKPRALSLMTGHLGTMRWTHPDQRFNWEQRVQHLGISYLILDVHVDRDILLTVEESPQYQKVWENEAYRIFAVL